MLLDRFKEMAFFNGERVETVQQFAATQVLNGDIHENGIVMPVRQCTSTREEIQVLVAVFINDGCSTRRSPHCGPLS